MHGTTFVGVLRESGIVWIVLRESGSVLREDGDVLCASAGVLCASAGVLRESWDVFDVRRRLFPPLALII